MTSSVARIKGGEMIIVDPKEANNGLRVTPFTIWLKKVWEDSGLNQADFVASLGLDLAEFGQQTLTKVLNGRYAKIPRGLFEAVACRSGVDEATLRALHRGDVKDIRPSTDGWAAVLAPSSSLQGVRSRVLELEEERRVLQVKLERNDAALQELYRLLQKS